MLVFALSGCHAPPVEGGPPRDRPERLVLGFEHVWEAVPTEVYQGVVAHPDAPCVDWTAVTTLPHGEPVVPASVHRLILRRFDPSVAEELEEGLWSWWDHDLEVHDALHAGDPRCCFDEWGQIPRSAVFGGGPTFQDGEVWTVRVSADGSGLVSGATVWFDAAADAADVVLADGMARNELLVQLGAPLAAPAGEPDLVLDWSELGGFVGFGQRRTALFAGRFDATPEELPDLLDAELSALVERYDAPVTPQAESGRLGDTRDTSGASFPGFDAEGVWVVGILGAEQVEPLQLIVIALEE